MRDDKDPGTIDMALPRKAGRPPVGGSAMTDAERAAAYRARRAAAAAKGRLAAVDPRLAERTSTMALIDTLRHCVTSHDKVNGLRVLRLLGQRIMELDDAPSTTTEID